MPPSFNMVSGLRPFHNAGEEGPSESKDHGTHNVLSGVEDFSNLGLLKN